MLKPISAPHIGQSYIQKKHLTKIPKSRYRSGRWLLKEAKERLCELVQRARTEGPQFVTVHDGSEVVIISVEEFYRLNGNLTGEALITAMQASPHREIDIEPRR
jgi:prevent-host-death family protein